jgi:hypothetical protein
LRYPYLDPQLPLAIEIHTSRPPVIMTTAAEYFLYLPEFRIAVCRTCRYSVYPDSAPTHLRDKYRGLTKQERVRIVEELNGWPEVCRSYDLIEIPQVVEKPLQGLRLFQDGK